MASCEKDSASVPIELHLVLQVLVGNMSSVVSLQVLEVLWFALRWQLLVKSGSLQLQVVLDAQIVHSSASYSPLKVVTQLVVVVSSARIV